MAKSSTDSRPDDSPASLPDAAKVVAWGLVFWGGVQLAGAAFEKNATATLLVQAALAEWGAGRIGIAWTEGRALAASNLTRRIATGAAIGGGAAAIAVLLSLAVRAAALWPATPALGALFIGLATSSLAAVRDELLLRGVVLRATRGLLPPWAALLAAGATAAAASFGASSASGALLLGEALRGVALGGVWQRDRGAWMACAANAVWMWAFGAVTRGGLLDVRFGTEPQASAPTLAVLAVAAAAAVWTASRSSRGQAEAA